MNIFYCKFSILKKRRNQPYLLFTPALDINLSRASNISLTSYMCDLFFLGFFSHLSALFVNLDATHCNVKPARMTMAASDAQATIY